MKGMTVNACVASLVFLLTFLITINHNTLMTSFMRAMLGFVVFFFLMFPMKWMIQWLVNQNQPESGQNSRDQPSYFQVETPDEDLLHQIQLHANASKENEGLKSVDDFKPLSPPTLKRKDASQGMKPEDIANAVRVLSNE